MGNNAKKEMSFSGFVNYVKNLEVGRYVFQHQIEAMKGEEYVQLPYKVTIAFKRLEMAVNSPELKTLDPQRECIDFIQSLIAYAKGNYGPYGNAEKDHAEYLLGLLMHHDIVIKENDKMMCSVKGLVFHSMRREGFYGVDAAYHSEAGVSDSYDFLSKKWLASQHYPDDDKLMKRCAKNIAKAEQQKRETLIKQEQERLLQEEEQRRQARRQEEELRQQEKMMRQLEKELNEQRIAKSFKNVTLNLTSFSYLLEAFIKANFIELNTGFSGVSNKPKLSSVLTSLMLAFSKATRENSSEAAKELFVRFMKELIASAKYQKDGHANASFILLGFFIYHDFKFQVGNELFKVSDILNAETNPNEREIMVKNYQHFPFICHPWQKDQNYPGKEELEWIYAQPTPNVSTQAVNQSAFLPFYRQTQQVRTPWLQQNNQVTPVQTFTSPFFRM